jgi:hypothetical protein
VPRSFPQLIQVLRGFLRFAACFYLLANVWRQHVLYFRRYGLQDTPATVLNCALLLFVLFYVSGEIFALLQWHAWRRRQRRRLCRLRECLTDSRARGVYIAASLGYFAHQGDLMRHVQSEGTPPTPTTGIQDDDDDRDDEHDGENEAPIREVDDQTEAPEEFEIDDEDELGHPEDDDADEIDDV